MKKIINLLFCMIALSCYEDKGSYDHVYSNVKEIKRSASSYVDDVVLGDTIKIYPQITWIDPSVDTLNYEYYYVFEGDTIGREKELIYPTTQVGSFTGFFIMVNKETQLASWVELTYDVTSPFAIGWLILSELEGKTALSMLAQTYSDYEGEGSFKMGDLTPEGDPVYIRSGSPQVYKWEDHIDVYHELHPNQPLGSKPLSIAMMYNGYSGGSDSEIVVIQEGRNNFVLNANDFSQKYLFNEDFGSGIPTEFVPVDFQCAGGAQYMYDNDGNFYWRKMNVNTPDSRQCRWENQLYFGNNAKVTRILNTDYPMNNIMLLHDEANNAVIGIKAELQNREDATARILNFQYPTDMPSNFIPFENLGDYKLLTMSVLRGGAKFNSGSFYAILEKDGKIYRQKCTFKGASGTAIKVEGLEGLVDITDSRIGKNSIYCPMEANGDYMLVAEGSKLYFHEIYLPERGFKLFHDFGSKIISITESPASFSAGVALENGEFHIMIIDDVFFMDENLGKKATYHVTKGLGNIKDVVFKNKTYSGWYSDNHYN